MLKEKQELEVFLLDFIRELCNNEKVFVEKTFEFYDYPCFGVFEQQTSKRKKIRIEFPLEGLKPVEVQAYDNFNMIGHAYYIICDHVEYDKVVKLLREERNAATGKEA